MMMVCAPIDLNTWWKRRPEALLLGLQHAHLVNDLALGRDSKAPAEPEGLEHYKDFRSMTLAGRMVVQQKRCSWSAVLIETILRLVGTATGCLGVCLGLVDAKVLLNLGRIVEPVCALLGLPGALTTVHQLVDMVGFALESR